MSISNFQYTGTYNIGIGSTVSNYVFNTNISSTTDSSLKVKGDAQFDGNITWKGRNLEDLFSSIEKRLAILVPDPEKLEHFESLRKAYEHYKTLEALCQLPGK